MSHAIPLLFIVLIIFSTFGILADALIVYGIFRFKKLKTPSNIFLANWAIADLLSIIIVPTNLIVYLGFFGIENSELCLTVHATIAFHLTVVFFALLLCIDWCTAVYFPRISERLRKHYSFIIGFIWLTALLFYILSAGLCIGEVHYYLNAIVFIIAYAINVLFVIVLQCSRIIPKCRTSLRNYSDSLNGRLAIITIITCSYLIGIVNTALTYFDVYRTSYNYVISTCCIILSALAVLGSSVMAFGVLCWLDKDFRLYVLPNGRGSHERFENDVSENEDSVPVTFNNTVNCTLANSNQNIAT